jgi:hypothetical protein
MKIVIWIASLFGLEFANLLIAELLNLNFKLGSVVILIIWFFLARWLCSKWDARQLQKSAKGGEITIRDAIRDLPGTYLKELEAAKGDKAKVSALVTEYVKRGFIARAHSQQVIDMYSSKDI